ncbi:MAG: hypothetical protein V3W44_06180 [Dehalococcoidales bacterium]
MTEKHTTKKHIDVELLEALQGLLNTVDSDPTASDKEVMQAIDWVRIRNSVARAESELEIELEYEATICLSRDVDEGRDETTLAFADGRYVVFSFSDTFPMGSFVRVYDEGEDIGGFSMSEVRESPGSVLGEFFEMLCSIIKSTGTMQKKMEKYNGIHNRI